MNLLSLIQLAVVLLSVGAILCGVVVFLLARALITPPRMTDGKAAYVLKRLSPGDLGMPFEDIRFDIRDSGTGEPLRIAGWWIPCPQARGRCVILIHGYADAKVGVIAWAPTWHALGYHILAIDMRAHGESTGRHCTGGFFERHDVSDVINRLRAARPGDTGRLVLFGVSFGAAVAVATAALRDDVDAVVLDSPVPDFAQGAELQMNLRGAPGGFLHRCAVRLAEWITGARFRDVRMLDLLPRLNCPALIIAPEHDALLADGVADQLRDALPTHASSQLHTVPGAEHLMALPADPAGYARTLSNFLEADVPDTAVAMPLE